MNKYKKGNILINPTTGTIVKSTGVHGDKTMRYRLEAYRLLDNNEWSKTTELFMKQPFNLKED